MRATAKLPVLTCLLLISGLLGRAQSATVRVAVPTLSMVVIAFTAAKEEGLLSRRGFGRRLGADARHPSASRR